MSRRATPARLAVTLVSLFAAGCVSEKLAMQPTVLVQSGGGTELGVSTEYGLVFLGSRSRAGEVEIVAWFGDGPNVELTVVEPIGQGLYTAEVDILLPWVELSFDAPEPGEKVRVVGRSGGELWERDVEVASHPSLEAGIVLPVIPELEEDPTQVGAGVFVRGPQGRRRLVGLVSGQLELTSPGGDTSRLLTVVGPDQLWRLVVHRRQEPLERRWIYRDDIL